MQLKQKMLFYAVLMILLSCSIASGYDHCKGCSVGARTESGWVCGQKLYTENGVPYLSFKGIPYAKQPLGLLRFKELEPAEHWYSPLCATTEGPSCYQHNIFLGDLLQPQGFSEACIHVNVHVPIYSLREEQGSGKNKGLPIFVFIHGGAWIGGSGDADTNGPEYLVEKGVMVITFNYRVDVMGFLSLNTSKIPGNNGLRDIITLLRWVKRNAEHFGGDPNQITLAGQSAGSTNAHLLSVSPAAKGLINRVWLMSGTANPRSFTTSRVYAEQLATKFLTYLGLNGTDYDTVHDKLVQIPIEEIHEASRKLLPLGPTTFMPVLESPLPGVTAIIADEPDVLISKGNADNIPIVIGFANAECETFRHRFEDINKIPQIKNNPVSALPPQFIFGVPQNVSAAMAKTVADKYFKGEPTMDEYIKLCSDSSIVQPSLKYAKDRVRRTNVPVYVYKFSYEAKYSVIKIALNLTFSGAGHDEIFTNILKVNSLPVPHNEADDDMKDWMSGLVANFVKTGSPTPDNSWPPQSATDSLHYQEFVTPYEYKYRELSKDDEDSMSFFDKVFSLS